MAFQPLPYRGFRVIYLIEVRGFSFMDASLMSKCGVMQGSSLGPLHFSIFTNDLPLALNKACVSMYADDSTIYTSVTTANEVTENLNKELQSVLEWVASNKLVLSIVFGTNNSLNSRPQLNLVMNGVAVEQVEETELLGVTLDCKLSWSKHIDSMVVKVGRGLSVIKRCFAFLHLILIIVQSWSSVAKKDLVKLQLDQNRVGTSCSSL
jgi:hypothetical protein